MRKIKCIICGKIVVDKSRRQNKRYCSKNCWKERLRLEYTQLPHICYKKGRGMSTILYTDGFTEELKPMVKKIKDKVLRDCIRNPRKFLK